MEYLEESLRVQSAKVKLRQVRVLATKTVEHSERSPQKTFFSLEEFEELDESAKFQAKAVIRAVDAPNVQQAESEDSIIAFGSVTVEKTYRGSGETVRCAVEGAITLENKEDLVRLCQKRTEQAHFRTDSKSSLCTPEQVGRSFIFRPPLISNERCGDASGYWSVVASGCEQMGVGPVSSVSSDGRDLCPSSLWTRLENFSRLFCEETMQGQGACPGFMYMTITPLHERSNTVA